MEVVQLLHSDSKVRATALKQMASLRPVLGEEVEVVSHYIESARELRSPYPDECPADVPEIELWLDRRGFGQRQTFQGGFHGASVDVVKVTVDAKCIEEIVGITIPVADGPEFLEARCDCDCLVLVRCKLYNNGEGRSCIVDDLVHGAIAAHHHRVERAVHARAATGERRPRLAGAPESARVERRSRRRVPRRGGMGRQCRADDGDELERGL